MTTQPGAFASSILLSFRATNVRSFKNQIELNLLSTTLAEREFVREVPWRDGGHVIRALPVAAVFGANASGKTNLLRAMNDMRNLVLHSFRSGDPSGGMDRHAFLPGSDASDLPSSLEVDLILHGVRHEYGFEFTNDEVVKEWAYRFPHGRKSLIFRRDGNSVPKFGSASQGKSRAARDVLRPNSLYLSAAAAVGHPILMPLYEWFGGNLLLAEANSRSRRQAFTKQMLDDDIEKKYVEDLLGAADIGVKGAQKVPLDPVFKEKMEQALRILLGTESEPDGVAPPAFEQVGVNLIHETDGVSFAVEQNDESLGTLVWFGLIGPVVNSLLRGSVFLADELDASLHPILANQLVRLFQSPKTNPHNAQLIFNTHNVALIGDPENRLLGRDQIWFAMKPSDASSRLYPLTDMDPRKDEAIGARYLLGRYGAIPILSNNEFDTVAELVTNSDK